MSDHDGDKIKSEHEDLMDPTEIKVESEPGRY